MDRSGWLAVVALGLAALGLVARARWPSAAPALDCAPSAVRLVPAAGGPLAVCAGAGAGARPGGGAALALGLKLDLNQATAEELTALPGVGPSLAHGLVEARRARGGRFESWDQVDAVPGVGEAKLRGLQATTELR